MSALTLRDLSMFSQIRVSPELLTKAQIKRVTDPEAREILGLNGKYGDMAGILFPYLSLKTGNRVTARVRRDNPEIEDGKPKNKYVSGYGDHRHVYAVPESQGLLDDREAPIILVEAEKSALALWEWSGRTGQRIFPIGLGGCYAWRGRIGKLETSNGHRVDEVGLLPELREWCANRRVYILYDANAGSNPKVKAARRELGAVLRKIKADVRVLELPASEGVNGPDDLIGAKGDQALLDLFATPQAVGDTKTGNRANGKYSPSVHGDIVTVPYSDDDLALKFSAAYPNLRYTHMWNKWHEWNGAYWQEDRDIRIFELAREICRTESESCDKSIKPHLTSAGTRAAVVNMARSDKRHRIVPETWDADDWILSTPGGIVDLRTGELRAARASDYCTKVAGAAPADYVSSDCLWFEFLGRVTDGDSELQGFLERVAGYCLTGSVREEAFFFFYGGGQNGKGKFLGAMGDMLNDYHRVAPASLLLQTKNESHPTELAGLYGARIVTYSETQKGQKWNESKLKSITGGDKLTARYMRGDFFDFQPKFKILFSANDKPSFNCIDKAIERRLYLVPFNVTIPEAERDFDLAEKLRRELPQILRWAIDGCLEWQRIGLAAPDCVRSASGEYITSQDLVSRWKEECCEVGPNFRDRTNNLFQSWKQWATDQNEFVGKQRTLTEALERLGFRLGGDGRRYLYGIRLKTEQTSV